MALLAVSTWLVATLPGFASPLAQQGETPTPSMTEVFLKQPDIIAPLVVPMLGACGGILVLGAFLAWVYSRLQEQ
jgi:hypothetical protein